MFFRNKVKKEKTLVEAIQYTVCNLNEIIAFIGSENVEWCSSTQELWVTTPRGTYLVPKGSYIVKKQKKEYYLLAERYFSKLYGSEGEANAN